MQFKDHNTVDDLVKNAEAEVLPASISVDSSGSFSVVPIKCPGESRKDDILKGGDERPICVTQGKFCPHFLNAEFIFENYIKKIVCGAI